MFSRRRNTVYMDDELAYLGLGLELGYLTHFAPAVIY